MPHRRLRRAPAAESLLSLLAACSSAPVLPEGAGQGLVAFDPTPPPGATTWGPPEWSVGDRFVLLRGGVQRIEFRVEGADEQGYLLVDSLGARLRRGPDLSNIGEWVADEAGTGAAGAGDAGAGDALRAVHQLTPPDVRFHWPLWVGKKWRCEYVDRTAGGAALPVEASYVVEDRDTVVTAGGTFDALRILRKARLQLQSGTFLDRVMVIWYSPELGLEVRQVYGDTQIELLEWSRSPDPAGSSPGAVRQR